MAAEAPFALRPDEGDGGMRLHLSGALTLPHVEGLRTALDRAGADRAAAFDLSGVQALDTAGAWALARHAQARIEGAQPAHATILATVAEALPPAEDPDSPRPLTTLLRDALAGTGRGTMAALTFLAELLAMLGVVLARVVATLRHPSEFRLTALVHHCQEVGLRAVPIVALMAFLIGVVLAFQGSVQLRQFGAEVFVVELIAISILRELGILLTAIIVAGRTASAFTAAIGSMKMREEIDAMRTLGMDPAQALFVPRVLALLIMLPILGLVANVAGLFGGALMSWIELGISPAMFVTRLVEQVHVNHAMVGITKAPVFALIIGVVGCHAGMRVKGNAESLGAMTSASVVTAIFAVIVADALFSVFFARLGV